jgi:hypothetical protein
MFTKAQAYIASMQHPIEYAGALRLFVRLVYAWFIISIFMTWDIRSLIWGPETVLMRFGGASNITTNVAYALVFKLSLFPWVFWTHLIGAIASMFEFKYVWLPRLLTWFTGLLLFYAGYNAFNAGNVLMLAFAFYCIPVRTKTNDPFQHILNHLSRTASIAQIVLLYLVAALYKLNGDMWPSGEALYYTLEIERFSTDWIKNSGITHQWFLMKALTFGVMAYQFAFPVLIWFKKIKTPLLLVGVLFHLTTGVVMHLWDFALAMIFSYAIFLRKK